MTQEQNTAPPTRLDGLHCVYGTCKGPPNGTLPMCNPGCSFTMTAIDPLTMVRRAIEKECRVMEAARRQSVDQFIGAMNARLNELPIGSRIGITKIMLIEGEVRQELEDRHAQP